MPTFFTEPAVSYADQNKTAVLLLNLGTPNAPTAEAVRPYLHEFLSDHRVVELPSFVWKPLLHGVVLPFRPKKSAHGYSKVWFPEGSPLAVYTTRQTTALQAKLGNDVIVCHAMTYGEPSVADVIHSLKAKGVSQLLVLPLYPQYAASSTGAALDKVFQIMLKQRNQMSLRTIARFCDDTAYIQAMKAHIEAYWQANGRSQKLMLSFHSIPQANHDQGDPYQHECRLTATLLADALGLKEDDYIVSFQSRFGKAKWIGPSTQDLLDELPKQGTTSLDVFCPGFVSDCLETMEEIAITGREQFHAAGGKQFQYIPCLNTNNDWITALAELAKRNLAGWV